MIALMLGAILLVILCGGLFVSRALLAIVKLLEDISGKLPSSRLLTALLSFGDD